MNMNRCISIILTIFVLCSSIMVAPITGASDYSREDDRYYNEANMVITQLVGTLFDGEAVTREQFAVALAKTMKISGIETTDLFFSDVGLKNENYQVIYALENLGVISRSDRFYPSDNITLAQAVKMCICLIGYNTPAELNGGYPYGYLALAKELNLSYSIDQTEEFTAVEATKLLYSMLCCTIAVRGGFNGAVHYADTDRTYLERLYDVSCRDGVIKATNICPENDGSPKKDGYIIVNEVKYSYDGATDAMLGKNVRVFFEREDRHALFVVERNNTMVTDNYENVTLLTNGKLSIDRGHGTIRHYKTDGARYIYNGRKVSYTAAETIVNQKRGDYTCITLLDNNADDNYEYVFLYDYRYLIADRITAQPPAITDANRDLQNAFRAADSNVVLSVYDEAGAAIEFDDIGKNDVLAVAQSADGRYACIRKLSQKTDGVLSAMDSEGTVKIGDGEYTLTDYADRNYKNVTKIGASYSFLIGFENDIIALNNYSSKMEYGYLAKVAMADSAFSREVQMKVFTTDGTMRIFDVERARINGSQELVKAQELLPVLESNCGKIIKYKSGADGKICAMDTAEVTTGYKESDEEEDSLLQYDFGKTEFEYRSGGYSCEATFNVNSSLIFVVPTDANDEDGYYITDKTGLFSGTKYNFDIYDLSEVGTARILVTKDRGIKSRTNYMIEKIREEIMPDGSYGKALLVYTSGSFTKIYMGAAVESTLHEPLHPGDIIQATIDDEGNARFIDPVFSAEKMDKSGNDSIKYESYTGISYYYGSLYYTDGIYAYISKAKNIDGYDYAFGNLKNFRINVSNIGLINKERNEIRLISPAELQDYKSFGEDAYYLVIRQNAQAPMEVYAYEAK